jgi:transcriptional regulator with XRE-family HTH domain
MTDQEVIACQYRAARAMARLKMAELARKARVAPNTIVRIESGRNVSSGTLCAVRDALEAAGIEFLDRGIRLKVVDETDVEADIEQKVARVLSLAQEIAGLPVVRQGSPEELIGYDEFGAPR